MTELGAVHIRTTFMALPDALEGPDGSAIATCPACGVAGAATLAADDWPTCGSGCTPEQVGAALYRLATTRSDR